MSDNLPAIVTRVGGELEKVVSDIENYTSGQHPLDRKGQMALARMVEDRPELNTESRIALLVDALTWHGLEQKNAFMALVDDNDVETVYLALDYLFEEGEREHDTDRKARESEDKSKLYSSMRHVSRVVDVIVKLRESGVEISNVERLSDCIYQRGGLNLEKGVFYDGLTFDDSDDNDPDGEDTDDDNHPDVANDEVHSF